MKLKGRYRIAVPNVLSHRDVHYYVTHLRILRTKSRLKMLRAYKLQKASRILSTNLFSSTRLDQSLNGSHFW